MVESHKQELTTEYYLTDALGSVRQLTDTAGAVTLTQSYSPYGETISSIGNGATAYQFTGEMRDANGLTYLRARYLDSSTGRFTQRDPSGLEANLYLYAAANPVNRIDPTGLFSREQIAKSFGVGSFENVLTYYDRNDEHWGFLAALLRALPGDKLKSEGVAIGPAVGTPVRWSNHLSKIYRDLGYSQTHGITIDGMPLATIKNELISPTASPHVSFPWRSDPSSFYTLQDLAHYDEEYVDGSLTTELPDFWMISVGGGNGIGGEGVYIMDRFGQSYFSVGVFLTAGPFPVSITYGEGYVNERVQSDTRMLPNQTALKTKLEKENLCFGLFGSVIGGGGTSWCTNKTNVSVFSVGLQVGAEGVFNPSYTFPLTLNPRHNWNWVNDARVNGVMRHDILKMPSVMYDECNTYIPLSGR